MITRLLLFNIFDFAVYVTSALVLFSAAVLFFNAWKLNQSKKTILLRSLGFLFLSLSYLIYASFLRNPILGLSLKMIQVLALSLILISLIKEPVLGKPKIKENKKLKIVLPVWSFSFKVILFSLTGILNLAIAWRYLKRYRVGLDRQLKQPIIAFSFFTLSELLNLPLNLFADTQKIFWSQILAEHGLVWNLWLLCQLVGIIILALWIWGYIRFRLRIQIFSIILTSVFLIFLLTTFSFSFLLLKNLENNVLGHLATDAKVFQYVLDQLQLESLSNAKALASDSALQAAILNKDIKQLYSLTEAAMIDHKLGTLIVTSETGEVLMRTEDQDHLGDSLVDDPLVKSALANQPLGTLVSKANPIKPEVYVQSAVPIKTVNGKLLGALLIGFAIDDTFVDGVKTVTGLDTTIFAGDIRVATTIIAPDGKSRFVGTLESNPKILTTVLESGQDFVGNSEILNQPYSAAYTPLKQYGSKVIGMLFIGRPQYELLELAQQSINYTFFGSLIMMLISVVPAYFLARFIEENLSA